MHKWKLAAEVGHSAYIAIAAVTTLFGLAFGAGWWIMVGVLSFLAINWIANRFHFEKCTGDCRFAIDIMLLSCRVALLTIVAGWALLAVFHDHGTKLAAKLIQERMVEIWSDSSSLPQEVKLLKNDFRWAPQPEFLNGPHAAIAHNAKLAALPLQSVLQALNYSALAIIQWASIIAFAACFFMTISCVMARLMAPLPQEESHEPAQ